MEVTGTFKNDSQTSSFIARIDGLEEILEIQRIVYRTYYRIFFRVSEWGLQCTLTTSNWR